MPPPLMTQAGSLATTDLHYTPRYSTSPHGQRNMSENLLFGNLFALVNVASGRWSESPSYALLADTGDGWREVVQDRGKTLEGL